MSPNITRCASISPVSPAQKKQQPASGSLSPASPPRSPTGFLELLANTANSAAPRTPEHSRNYASSNSSTFANPNSLHPSTPPRSTTPTRKAGSRQVRDIADIEQLPSSRFLIDNFHSLRLAQLVVHLNQVLCSRWAMTGSVAMNMHAVQRGGELMRPFHDVDIQIDHGAYDVFKKRLCQNLSETGFTQVESERDIARYRFHELDIDFVESKLKMRPEFSDSEAIAGIPVLTLKALSLHKRSQINHFDPAVAHKAVQDLNLMEQLMEADQPDVKAVRSDQKASPQRSGQKRPFDPE
jgi:hypothetical protein